MRARSVVVMTAVLTLGACTGARGSTSPTSATVSPTTAATTSTAVATTSSSVATTSTTLGPTTTVAVSARRALGTSVEGRPIELVERGDPRGVDVLVIGCIHGDEDAGVAVVERLESDPVPAGVHLLLIPTMNPDGEAHHTRTNAHQVDLNRNFPYRWAPLGVPGDSEYAGSGAASEPETQAVEHLIEQRKPALTIWYHQDLNRIAPSTGRAGRIRQRYAQLTGLPLAPVTGGTYTGTASPWAQRAANGVAFIVELGPTLSSEQAAVHADAVLTVAGELGTA